MPAFEYHATDASGKKITGINECDNAKQLRQQLRAQGLMPIEITEVKGKNVGKNQTRYHLTRSELVLFTRHLSALLITGIPIADALTAVAEQLEKPASKSVILGIRSRVYEGYTLANSMDEFAASFPATYRTAVNAGEQTGHLDQVLEKLADHLEQQQLLRQKILQALIYPSLLITVAFFVVGFLLAFVVPKIVDVFIENNQVLPVLTRILIAISHVVKHYGVYFIILIGVGAFAFSRSLKTPAFREKLHSFLLKIPVIGPLVKTINTTRFLYSFALLNQAGVEVLQAMRTAAGLITNIPLQKLVLASTQKVKEGVSINQALRDTHCFSPISLHLIASGENTSRLSLMLERAASNQDRFLNSLIDTVLKLFEPILILVMGGIVLFIVLAILLPIFSIDQMTSLKS